MNATLHRGFEGWLRWLGAVGAAIAVLVLAGMAAPGLPLHPLLGYVVAFVAVGASVLATAAACPAPRPRHLALLPVPAASLLAVHLSGGHGLDAAVAVTASLLLAGTLLGATVGTAIEHPGHLVFVAVVSAAADIFSVNHPAGPSAAIVESEAALSLLALPWPMLGTPAIEPVLGVGDVVFTALYVAAARAHGLGRARTLWALAFALVATLVTVIALELPLPALPYLGAAMLIAHPEARRPPAADRVKGTLAAAAIVAAVVAAFVLRSFQP